MHARLLVLLVALFLGACRGFDPRRFSELEYGVTRAEAEEVLPDRSASSWRTWSATGRVLELTELSCRHPHPDYVLGWRDGQLVALQVLQAWRRDLPEDWPTAHAIEGQLLLMEAERLPLDWAGLKPFDARYRKNPDESPWAFLALSIVYPWVLPGTLVVLPIFGVVKGIQALADRSDPDVLRELPEGTAMDAVLERHGEPDARRRLGPGQESWRYEHALSTTGLGFEDGRLRWIWVDD